MRILLQRVMRSKFLNNFVLYRRLYLKAKLFKDRKKRKTFHQYGLETLEMFDKCMREYGFKYTLAFGTLLGAVRDHDFIKHDNDIDIAMWIDDYDKKIISCLENYGFKLIHSFSVENDKFGKEDTFEYKCVQLDIFYFYNTDKIYSCYFASQPNCFSRAESIKRYGGLLPVRMYLPLSKDRKEITFKGIKVFVPFNAHEVLQYRYGENYMTPIANWKPHTQYVKEWPEKIGEYIEY